MKQNKLADLSLSFSVAVVQFCDSIKGHYSITNQLERCSTSIGANIREANYAHSRADFIAKLQISLKECYETEYWLEILEQLDLCDKNIVKALYNKCGTLRKLLVTSINTAKSNQTK